MRASTYMHLWGTSIHGNLLLQLRNSRCVRRIFLEGRKSQKIALMEIATAFTIYTHMDIKHLKSTGYDMLQYRYKQRNKQLLKSWRWIISEAFTVNNGRSGFIIVCLGYMLILRENHFRKYCTSHPCRIHG